MKRTPIQNKKKPCKGIGIAKGYGCGVLTYNRENGLGKSCCYAKWLFETEAGKLKMHRAINKVQKPRLEAEKNMAEYKSQSELKKAHEATKKAVHEYVRLRDKGKPCVSCDKPYNDNFHACHYFKAELFETLRYNLDNIHGGCPECNLFKGGNIEMYAARLPQRIGQERYNALQELANVDKHYSKVWNVENIKEVRDNIRELKKYLKK